MAKAAAKREAIESMRDGLGQQMAVKAQRLRGEEAARAQERRCVDLSAAELEKAALAERIARRQHYSDQFNAALQEAESRKAQTKARKDAEVADMRRRIAEANNKDRGPRPGEPGARHAPLPGRGRAAGGGANSQMYNRLVAEPELAQMRAEAARLDRDEADADWSWLHPPAHVHAEYGITHKPVHAIRQGSDQPEDQGDLGQGRGVSSGWQSSSTSCGRDGDQPRFHGASVKDASKGHPCKPQRDSQRTFRDTMGMVRLRDDTTHGAGKGSGPLRYAMALVDAMLQRLRQRAARLPQCRGLKPGNGGGSQCRAIGHARHARRPANATSIAKMRNHSAGTATSEIAVGPRRTVKGISALDGMISWRVAVASSCDSGVNVHAAAMATPAAQGAPPAADAEAIAEEKKKRKKEDAKIFFEQKKKQKQEEKEKRDAAIARGELPPEPEKPKAAPLKEPPLLFPHAQALHSTFWDPSADPDALRAVVQELLAARRQLAAETEERSRRGTTYLSRRGERRC
ncbi:unnamed protein product [Prorocentrum cordatum]|uniref:Uncharacterized protein n=1 Tax=Prorocentrum cordatum TaxID=2364126 RepID=A0ABN9YD28_9DINO|nr:unnamed protein product [Polarella glacialis]